MADPISVPVDHERLQAFYADPTVGRDQLVSNILNDPALAGALAERFGVDLSPMMVSGARTQLPPATAHQLLQAIKQMTAARAATVDRRGWNQVADELYPAVSSVIPPLAIYNTLTKHVPAWRAARASSDGLGPATARYLTPTSNLPMDVQNAAARMGGPALPSPYSDPMFDPIFAGASTLGALNALRKNQGLTAATKKLLWSMGSPTGLTKPVGKLLGRYLPIAELAATQFGPVSRAMGTLGQDGLATAGKQYVTDNLVEGYQQMMDSPAFNRALYGTRPTSADRAAIMANLTKNMIFQPSTSALQVMPAIGHTMNNAQAEVAGAFKALRDQQATAAQQVPVLLSALLNEPERLAREIPKYAPLARRAMSNPAVFRTLSHLAPAELQALSQLADRSQHASIAAGEDRPTRAVYGLYAKQQPSTSALDRAARVLQQIHSRDDSTVAAVTGLPVSTIRSMRGSTSTPTVGLVSRSKPMRVKPSNKPTPMAGWALPRQPISRPNQALALIPPPVTTF